MDFERRRNRSDCHDQSLQLWLAAVACRTRAEALVLADELGLLVASSFSGREAQDLAALAPALLVGEQDRHMRTCWREYPVQVSRVDVNGVPLLLCAVGTVDELLPELEQVARGVQRILLN